MCFLHKKNSSRSTQTRQKDDTKFVILNATFNIFKVNATGSVYRGCIYFENLLAIAVVIRKSNRDFQELQFPGIIGVAYLTSKTQTPFACGY